MTQANLPIRSREVNRIVSDLEECKRFTVLHLGRKNVALMRKYCVENIGGRWFPVVVKMAVRQHNYTYMSPEWFLAFEDRNDAIIFKLVYPSANVDSEIIFKS